jgi:pre-rRNA-processing protein IPI3
MNLFRQRDDKAGGQQVTEAIGGSGVTDIIRVGDENPEARKQRLITVGCVQFSSPTLASPIYSSLILSQTITALAFSLTSTLLLAGTSAGLINIYDVPSHQLLRTISTHKDLSITHLATMLKPPDLIGHVSLNLNLSVGSVAEQKDVMTVKPVLPFHRMRDVKARERHEVAMVLSSQDTVRIFP